MNSIMRRTVRGAATGLGALALIAGASACGAIGDLVGGGDEGDDPSAEQPAEDEGSESEDGASEGADEESAGGEDADAEESEGDDAAGGDAEAGPLSEEDLTASGDRALEFVKAAAAGDAATACSLALDPTTGSGMSGGSLDACVSGFEETAGEEGTELDPSIADAIDRSMIETTDNGDGTAAVSMMGSEAGISMIQGDDGQWYVDSAGLI